MWSVENKGDVGEPDYYDDYDDDDADDDDDDDDVGDSDGDFPQQPKPLTAKPFYG